VEIEKKYSASGGRLLVLDAFRAVAILGVMAHHYLPRWAPPDYPINIYGYSHSYPHWLDIGALGVQFFFIISGFVIFMTLERCGHLFEFWTRRLARLYPAYIICMMVTFGIVNAIGPAEFSSAATDIPANFFFLTPYISGVKFIEPAYWSLIVELQFYFWIGLVFVAAPRRFNTAWAIFSAVALVFWIVGSSTQLHVFQSIAKNVFLVTYLPEFTFGILCYRIHSRRLDGAWLLAASTLGIYSAVSQHLSIETHLAHLAMVTAFALFLSGKLNWLCVRPILLVGAISYPLYLLHQYVGVSLIATFTRRFGFPDAAAVVSAAMWCGLLAFGVNRLVELPAKEFILGTVRRPLRAWQSRMPGLALPRHAAG